uniref:Gnk2-homologous domain-containing protein n=1 Tax=Quercus lobata TaxID=97700 RepID=A0A7N2MUM1_QUELO
MEISPPFYMCSGNNVSANYDQFSQDLRTLLDSQRGRAAAGGSLYCSACLFGAMEDIRNYCAGKQRGIVIKPSCNLRFHVALFYDATADNVSNNTPAAKGTNAIKLKM